MEQGDSAPATGTSGPGDDLLREFERHEDEALAAACARVATLETRATETLESYPQRLRGEIAEFRRRIQDGQVEYARRAEMLRATLAGGKMRQEEFRAHLVNLEMEFAARCRTAEHGAQLISEDLRSFLNTAAAEVANLCKRVRETLDAQRAYRPRLKEILRLRDDRSRKSEERLEHAVGLIHKLIHKLRAHAAERRMGQAAAESRRALADMEFKLRSLADEMAGRHSQFGVTGFAASGAASSPAAAPGAATPAPGAAAEDHETLARALSAEAKAAKLAEQVASLEAGAREAEEGAKRDRALESPREVVGERNAARTRMKEAERDLAALRKEIKEHLDEAMIANAHEKCAETLGPGGGPTPPGAPVAQPLSPVASLAAARLSGRLLAVVLAVAFGAVVGIPSVLHWAQAPPPRTPNRPGAPVPLPLKPAEPGGGPTPPVATPQPRAGPIALGAEALTARAAASRIAQALIDKGRSLNDAGAALARLEAAKGLLAMLNEARGLEDGGKAKEVEAKLGEALALARLVEEGETAMGAGNYAQAAAKFSEAAASPGGGLAGKLLADARTRHERDRKRQEAARQAAELEKARRGKAGLEWVNIPGGTFTMGADENSDEKPRHSVTIKSFQMAKAEVTNRQYRACVKAGACTAPSSYEGDDDQPVVNVDWRRAKAFSAWVGGRLPSEAEWEYAARSAGKDRKYPWGDEQATCARAVISDGGVGCGRNSTWPVCSKTAGNTEQGLCDMAGNVWEWTQDWYHDSYKGAPSDGSAWESPAGSLRVFRGGSWGLGAGDARASFRSFGDPGYRFGYLGFRPAR